MPLSPYEEVGDDEVFYRRIPKSPTHYTADGRIVDEAFRPHKNDDDGLSITRKLLVSGPEAAAHGPSLKGYVVVWFTARELRSIQLTVVTTPTDDNPGHCSIPEMNAGNRREKETEERMSQLAAWCYDRVIFETPVAPPQ